MVQALKDSIHASHLLVPTPPVFKGDPFEYLDFKSTFTEMVDGGNIPSTRKIYYLKQYVDGSARAAIAGHFYGSSEEAY